MQHGKTAYRPRAAVGLGCAVALLAVVLPACRPAARVVRSPATAATALARAWHEVACLDFAAARPHFARARLAAPPEAAAAAEAAFGLALCAHHAEAAGPATRREAAILYATALEHPAGAALRPLVRLHRARLAAGEQPATPAGARAAAAGFRRAARACGDHWAAHEATLAAGQAEIFGGDTADVRAAVNTLATWIEDHPRNPLAALQWSLIAEAHAGPLDNPAAAVGALLAAEAAGLPPMTQRDAFYWRLAGLAERAGNRAVAVRYLERIIREEPHSGYGFEAQLRLTALGHTPPPLRDPLALEPPDPAPETAPETAR